MPFGVSDSCKKPCNLLVEVSITRQNKNRQRDGEREGVRGRERENHNRYSPPDMSRHHLLPLFINVI